jgi:hypothetical protein
VHSPLRLQHSHRLLLLAGAAPPLPLPAQVPLRAECHRAILGGKTKKYTRRHCTYSLPGLRAALPIALSQSLSDVPDESRGATDLPVSPLLKMRRWFRISWQYVAEYKKGSECAEIVRAMAALRSKRHRDTSVRHAVPVEAAMELGSRSVGGVAAS